MKPITMMIAAVCAIAGAQAQARVTSQQLAYVANPPKHVLEKCRKEPEGKCYVLTYEELKAALQAANQAGRKQAKQETHKP